MKTEIQNFQITDYDFFGQTINGKYYPPFVVVDIDGDLVSFNDLSFEFRINNHRDVTSTHRGDLVEEYVTVEVELRENEWYGTKEFTYDETPCEISKEIGLKVMEFVKNEIEDCESSMFETILEYNGIY
jgi:hypothetical protein